MYPLFLPDFNETWIFTKHFEEIFEYLISWKSVHWEQTCSMRMEGRTDRETHRHDKADSCHSQSCECARKLSTLQTHRWTASSNSCFVFVKSKFKSRASERIARFRVLVVFLRSSRRHTRPISTLPTALFTNQTALYTKVTHWTTKQHKRKYKPPNVINPYEMAFMQNSSACIRQWRLSFPDSRRNLCYFYRRSCHYYRQTRHSLDKSINWMER